MYIRFQFYMFVVCSVNSCHPSNRTIQIEVDAAPSDALRTVGRDQNVKRCVNVLFGGNNDKQIRQLQRVDQTGEWRAYVLPLDEIGDVSRRQGGKYPVLFSVVLVKARDLDPNT